MLFISLLSFNQTIFAQDNAPSYQSMIQLGDKEYNKGEYIKAKSYYQEALRIKKDDANAKSKLNKTLQKIREQGEKEEIFYQHIDIADNHYNNGDYEKALSEYNKAIKIFPKDSYTLEKIQELNTIIKEEKDKIASFNEMLKIADNFFSQEKYTEAVLQYESALKIYPNHITTKEKLENAKAKKEEYDLKVSDFEKLKREGNELELRKKYSDAIEKYQQAAILFPDDEDIKNTIISLETKKDHADRYNAQISIADSLYLEKSYEKAKEAYNEALSIISNDDYSLDMISRIDETLNSDEYLSLKNYLDIIEEAKKFESENKWDEALDKYQSALKMNPNDEFSTQKINYLTELISNRNKEIQTNAQYAALISQGDKAIENNDYYSALDLYSQAYNLIPDRSEAKEKRDNTQKQINEIETQLALEKQKWDEYYNIAMDAAQSFMTQQNYAEAIKEYNKALRYKNNDALATQGLNEATKLNEARLAAISAEYNQHISNGNIQYESKNYDQAIEHFSKALALNTGDTYPSDMINRIGTILQENKLETLVGEKLEIASNTTKRFSFKPIDVTVRKNNYILIKGKNLSNNSFTMFVAYGNDKGRSGSFILRIPDNENTNDFIIRIGAQYKWFSEDNTWIEMTPENGNIEIELMEITKGN